MLATVLIALGASGVSALVAYVLGFSRGKTNKLAELHELQEEGWLVITYRGDPKKRDDASAKVLAGTPNGVENDPRIQSLLHRDESGDEDGIVSRSRRDAEERRTDWAKHMKATGAETVDDE